MIEFSLRTRELDMAVSKTQKIIDDIKADIKAGRLKPGDQIPSAKEIREKYDVSITTYRGAINWLKAEGLVKGLPGVGVFVADRK